MLPPVSDVPTTYQQLLEHTTAMLHPGGPAAVHAPPFGLGRTLPTGAAGPIAPPTAAGLLGWHQAAASLPPALPQPLDEVNGEYMRPGATPNVSE